MRAITLDGARGMQRDRICIAVASEALQTAYQDKKIAGHAERAEAIRTLQKTLKPEVQQPVAPKAS